MTEPKTLMTEKNGAKMLEFEANPIQEVGCPTDEWPIAWNECLYCGEAVQAPALYCCEEHEEGRSMR